MKRLGLSVLVGVVFIIAGCEPQTAEGQRVGNACPDIVGNDVDGKTIRLSDYKGKVVLVNFWGTWCGPCQQLMPHEARKVTQEYKDRPFVMIGVAQDNKETLKEFLAVKPLPWVNIVDGNQIIGRQWHVDVVPSFLLVDQHGVIRARWFSGVRRDASDVWEEVESLVKQAEVK
jgi:peroxiredoxin